jgi:hypothetical protein
VFQKQQEHQQQLGEQQYQSRSASSNRTPEHQQQQRSKQQQWLQGRSQQKIICNSRVDFCSRGMNIVHLWRQQQQGAIAKVHASNSKDAEAVLKVTGSSLTLKFLQK